MLTFFLNIIILSLTSIMIFMRWDSFAYSYTFTFCKDWSDTSKFKKVFNGRTFRTTPPLLWMFNFEMIYVPFFKKHACLLNYYYSIMPHKEWLNLKSHWGLSFDAMWWATEIMTWGNNSSWKRSSSTTTYIAI